MEKTFITVDGVERELVRVVVQPTPGNPEGRPRIDYRDHMAPGEQTVEEAAAAAAVSAAPSQEELDASLAKLPEAIAAGEYKDPEYVVTAMRDYFGDLFTADTETAVRDAFAKAATKATKAGKK